MMTSHNQIKHEDRLNDAIHTLGEDINYEERNV